MSDLLTGTTLRERSVRAIGDANLHRNLANVTNRLAGMRSSGAATLQNFEELREAARSIRAGVIARLPDLLEQVADRVEATVALQMVQVQTVAVRDVGLADRRQMARAFHEFGRDSAKPPYVIQDAGWSGGQHLMTRPLSNDLRKRVVRAVLGGESCRSVASRFGVSVSSVVK